MGDNILHEKGFGRWVIGVYNPEKEFGPFEGVLTASKDFHFVTEEDENIVVNIPSQNIAYCININICPNYNRKLED